MFGYETEGMWHLELGAQLCCSYRSRKEGEVFVTPKERLEN